MHQPGKIGTGCQQEYLWSPSSGFEILFFFFFVCLFGNVYFEFIQNLFSLEVALHVFRFILILWFHKYSTETHMTSILTRLVKLKSHEKDIYIHLSSCRSQSVFVQSTVVVKAYKLMQLKSHSLFTNSEIRFNVF